MRTPL
ncbi:hypothetical protein LINGRAHAP2_LOCUS16230 [Linum grandiflorum]